MSAYGFLADHGIPRRAQQNALMAAGCSEVWSEPSFTSELIGKLGKGDVLIVWRIDELDLSVPEIVELVASLALQQIGFKALVDGIDTAEQPSVQEFCLSLRTMRSKVHRKRVTAGIDRARLNGQPVGRQRKLSRSDVEVIYEMIKTGDITVVGAARQFGVSRNTLQRYLSEIRGASQRS